MDRRIKEHNTSTFNTFTSKYRPWQVAALFKVSENKSEALKLERFIKKQKSKTLLKQLAEPNFEPSGRLLPLVRVPYVRD